MKGHDGRRDDREDKARIEQGTASRAAIIEYLEERTNEAAARERELVEAITGEEMPG